MTAPAQVDLAVDGRVAWIVLNRPDHANRLDHMTMSQLVDALAAAATSGADVLRIAAAGNDFCTGRDGMGSLPDGVTRATNVHLIVEANAALAAFPGLSVASVRGRAMGFGCGLAVQADLTISARSALFGFDESRVGRPPRFVMGYLGDVIGPKRAVDLVATGRVLSATEAEAIGIVSRVVDDDALDEATETMVESLLELDSDALRTCKSYPQEVRRIDTTERGEYAFAQTVSPARA